MQGYIKLYRQIQKKGYYKKSTYIHLWVHLLLNANHKPKEFLWNNKLILIKEGQLLTGRKQLSQETGIPEGTTEDILNLFENEQQIRQQKTTKFRLITIVNWQTYQSNPTAKQQQADTNNNDKNDKNNIYINIYIANFKKINPTYERIYSNLTERAALERLIKKFGPESVNAKIDFIAGHQNDKYCPRAYTPYQMEKKWPQLEAYIARKTKEEREYQIERQRVKSVEVNPEGLKKLAEMKKSLDLSMPQNENQED